MYSSSFENVGLVFVWSHIYSRKQNIDFAWHLAIVLIAHLQFMLSGLDHDILLDSKAFFLPLYLSLQEILIQEIKLSPTFHEFFGPYFFGFGYVYYDHVHRFFFF